MLKKSMLKYLASFFIPVLLCVAGCNRFRGDQEIPSYLRIDSISIIPAFGLTPTSGIVDAWITLDGWNIGCYQLPLCIPVLKRGESEVLIQAGILRNNLSLRRGIYPFYSGVKFTVNFVEDSIINVTLKEDKKMQTAVTMRNSYQYLLLNEDFERSGRHSFDTISGFGSVLLEMKQCNTVPASTPEHLYGDKVGHIRLKKGDSCCIQTRETFIKGTETELPYNQPIFVEIDYLTNNQFEVGVVSRMSNRPYFHPIVIVGSQRNPEWSKIYVEISNFITEQLYNGVEEFKIFIRSKLDDDNQEANIYLDNIRLVFNQRN